MSTLLGVAFGHLDLQTSHKPTPLCEDLSKIKVYSNNPQSLEEWKGTVARNDPHFIGVTCKIICTAVA
jgi:hypothetical protein